MVAAGTRGLRSDCRRGWCLTGCLWCRRSDEPASFQHCDPLEILHVEIAGFAHESLLFALLKLCLHSCLLHLFPSNLDRLLCFPDMVIQIDHGLLAPLVGWFRSGGRTGCDSFCRVCGGCNRHHGVTIVRPIFCSILEPALIHLVICAVDTRPAVLQCTGWSEECSSLLQETCSAHLNATADLVAASRAAMPGHEILEMNPM